jgi:effector-binding domain-containing protein
MPEIQQRTVPEQLVLTEQRHITVPALSEWLPSTIGRLASTAERYGGIAGPVFVVYHGPVSEENDGPVEVCVPISAPSDVTVDSPTRPEPAHREAYVRITRAQLKYPEILSAYEAVSTWLKEHGQTETAAPREVYFTDVMAAGPTDQVCDVAFPIA